MNVRVRVTQKHDTDRSTVVEFAPVLAQMPRHQDGMPKDKDGNDTHPGGHGGHKHHRDARFVLAFETATPGFIEGDVLDHVEQQQQVGPDEIMRVVPVSHYKKGPIPTLFPRPDIAEKAAALQLGCEYDVAEPITADSTFTPVVHG